MAKRTSEIEALHAEISRLKRQLKEARKEVSTLEDESDAEMQELLRHFNLVIVDTRDDMRILNASGAIEVIFKDVEKKFQQGENLVKIIYRAAKNTKSMDEIDLSEDEQKDLEDRIDQFVRGSRSELMLRIVGERGGTGEVFMLEWKIMRKERYFKSFFKIIPTNTIVKKVQDEYSAKLENLRQNMRFIYGQCRDGITIIDIKSKILYMNSLAKKSFLSGSNNLLLNADMEGKYFKELFSAADSDKGKEIEKHIKNAVISKKPASFPSGKGSEKHDVEIYCLRNEKDLVDGIVLFSRANQNNNNSSGSAESSKIVAAMKQFAEENKVLKERVKELEYNHKWFMKNNKEYQDTIKLLYSFLENTPLPLSILSLPERTYEFTNIAFEEFSGKNRKELKGMAEKEIYSAEQAALLDKKTEEAVKLKMPVFINGCKLKAWQSVLRDYRNSPEYIIRIFVKNRAEEHK